MAQRGLDDEYGNALRRLKSVLRQLERMTKGLDETKRLPKPMAQKIERLRADEERISKWIDRYFERQEREAREWMASQHRP